MDIAVLGAGALGLSAALGLAEEGHDVTVYDPAPGSGSTAKAAGIVSTMTWNDDDAHLIQKTRGMVGELISLAAGAVPQARFAWRSHDSITIAKGDKLAVLDEMQHRLERITEEPERLGWREAAAGFPDLHFEPGEEVLVAQEDGVLEAGDFLDALRWRVESEGVSVVAERRSAQRPAADHDGVVVAAGAWSRALAREAGHALPVQHFRTQAASVELAADEPPILHDAVHGFYARPESEASVLAGDGTRLQDHDPDAYDEKGDVEFVEHIAATLPRRFTGGAEAVIRNTWAGLCVATPDRRPLCGPIPGADDQWVLTGDNGYGLMRCLALGERLADCIDGPVHPETDPSRFGGDWRADFEMREGFGF